MCAKKNIVEEEIEEKIIERSLNNAIHDYMMPYSEYIILERALPKVEDGLKPVQRRILFTMHELHLKPEGDFKKSARIVGDCLGKFHPHGDTSVYEAMVKLAQDFNMRCPLIDGQGNWGTADGHPAAAMRYTEAKMQSLSTELINDIDKNTVKWNKNFDDSLEEPDVLPGGFPNLLVNGSSGIAIGVSTKIPSHNLTEVIDGTIAIIDNPSIKLNELLTIIKGPDFPTGGFIIPDDSWEEIYTTGHGRFQMRAKVEIENIEKGKQNIIITEFPYGVNKSRLQIKIKDLRDNPDAKQKAIGENILGGIQEICDESDMNGIRVVIKLKKGEDAVKILNYLYEKTDLQCSFNVNMMAIANGKPQLLGLIPILQFYIEHRRTIIFNRTIYDLDVAKKRDNILSGYCIIFPFIDEVIVIIKASNSRNDAKKNLRKRFEINEKQADAVLDLKLANLTKMEIGKIQEELKGIEKNIAIYEKIIGSKKRQLEEVKKDLIEIKNKYPSNRLSIIANKIEDLEYKPFEVATEGGVRGYFSLSIDGNVRFISTREYLISKKEIPELRQHISKQMIYADKGETVLLISNLGNAYVFNSEEVMQNRWTDVGYSLQDLYVDAVPNEKIIFVANYNENNKDKDVIFVTLNGIVKRSKFSDYIINKKSYTVATLKDNDEIISAEIVGNDQTSLLFVSSDGMCINTLMDDYPVQGRRAGGVIGMSLNKNANIIFGGLTQLDYDESFGELVLIGNNGFAKRIILSNIEIGKRARKGVKIIDMAVGRLIFANIVVDPYDIALVTSTGEVGFVNTEQDIFIDRNRLSKGKPLVVAGGCVAASINIKDANNAEIM
ncbi:MAG: DNA topoisomerase (ATP-hydrolyzing) [Clostridia bacterium]